MKSKIVSIALLNIWAILFASILFGQSNVRGIITDKRNGEPIIGAELRIKISKKETISVRSKPDGTYFIKDVTPGTYDLECSYPGFISQRLVGITLKDGSTKLAYFRIQPGPSDEIEEIFTYASLQTRLSKEASALSRAGESIDEVPATIYAFSAEDISNRGYRNLGDLLKEIPEIEIQDQNNPDTYNTLSSRGLVGNEKLLVLIDGVRSTSMALTPQAIDKNFPIHYADRIEVVLGPSSSLYEEDAFVGVVNIVTPKGDKNKGIKVNGSYGSYHETDNAIYGGWGNKDISFNVMGSFYSSQNPYMPNFYKDDYSWFFDPYSTTGAMSLDQGLSDSTSNQLYYIDTIESFGMPTMSYTAQFNFSAYGFELGGSHAAQTFSTATGADPKYYVYGQLCQQTFSLSNLYLRHQAKFGDKGRLESLVNWNYYELHPKSVFRNIYTNYEYAYKFACDNNTRIRETFTYNFNQSHQLLASLSLMYNYSLPETSYLPKPFDKNFGLDAEGQNAYYLGSNMYDSDSTDMRIYQRFYTFHRFGLGTLLQYKFSLGEKFSVSVGGRLDYKLKTDNLSNTQNTILGINPRLALVYRPTSDWTFKLFYAEALVDPSPHRAFGHYGALDPEYDQDAKVTGFKGGFWRVPNAALKPEKIRTAELNVNYSNKNFVAKLDGYYSFGQNIIVNQILSNQYFQGIHIDAAEQAVNQSESHFYGGTLYLAYQKVFGKEDDFELKTNAAYTFADGQIDGVQQLGFTAQHTAKAGFFFRWKDLSLYASGIFRTASQNNGILDQFGNRMYGQNEPCFTLDLYAKYKVYENPKNGLGIEVFVDVDNATNARYYHVSTDNRAFMGAAPQQPIQILGGFKFSFMR
ncbi:MAG: TonB-dependent receptor [Aureispira sp.]|nr:TonB-dependent receptor [Aureispira sp.]